MSTPDQEDTGERSWGWDFEVLLPRVDGVTALAAEGFVPLESLAGEVELAHGWPPEHRREVRDNRFEMTGQEPFDDDELRLFLVRSPWPSIDVDDVVDLVLRWLRRKEKRSRSDHGPDAASIDIPARQAAVQEFFGQSEGWVRAYAQGRVNRLARPRCPRGTAGG